MKCTEAAGRVKLANQIKRGGCGVLFPHAIGFEMQRSSKIQFGIGSLLFAMLAVAGYFYGLNRGDTVRYDTTLSTKVYPIGNLLDANQPVDEQINSFALLIRNTIDPASWKEVGGVATLDMYPANRSIVVKQFGTEHDRISDLLKSLEAHINAKMTTVKYDASMIVSERSTKSKEQQLIKVCELLQEVSAKSDLGPVDFKLDSDNLVIAASAKDYSQKAIANYIDQLKFARGVISQIDK